LMPPSRSQNPMAALSAARRAWTFESGDSSLSARSGSGSYSWS
jgi:hypothetical protein